MRKYLAFVLCVASLGNAVAQQLPEPDKNRIAQADQVVRAYHANNKTHDNRVQVVYFHARDRDPLADYRPRINRILADVENFYAAELSRNGVSDRRVRFATDKDAYSIRLVKGRLPSEAYSYESGRQTVNEIRRSLANEIDFSRSHVLVLHGLCDSKPDGSFAFHAPYYGSGNQKSGICHAADCELLDPNLLQDTKRKIVFSEHYYRRREQSVASFNSLYLGGITHELGHGIGLPHDSGRPQHRSAAGVALMGSGNMHYREDAWGGKRPTYLCESTILRLLSNPLVTQSDRGRFDDPNHEVVDLQFVRSDGLEIQGEINSDIPAYGVIGSVWHPRKWPGNPMNDHGSLSHPGLVTNNKFQFHVTDVPKGDSRLRLSFLFCNGASRHIDFHTKVGQDGLINDSDLNAQWQLSRLERSLQNGTLTLDEIRETDVAKDASKEVRQKIQVIQSIVQTPNPIDLLDTDKKEVWLSDAKWESASVGWHKVARNYFDIDREYRNSIFLELDGRFYAKGLYAHSKSKHVFDLGKRWNKFSVKVGLRDGAHSQGSAIFKILGDGKTLVTSKVLRTGKSQDLEVDVSGVQSLELTTNGGEGHVHSSWAIWVSPLLSRK